MASVSKFDFEFGAWTDARGAWDEDDIPDELEAFSLTRLSLGMWKARSHGGLRAVLGRERFVFVVFRRRRAVPTLAARASELVSQQLGRRLQISVPSSPFDLGDEDPRRRGAGPGRGRRPRRDARRGTGPRRGRRPRRAARLHRRRALVRDDGGGVHPGRVVGRSARVGISRRAARRAHVRDHARGRRRARLRQPSVCRRAHRHRGATRHQTGVFQPRAGVIGAFSALATSPSRVEDPGGERRAFHRAKILRRSTPSQIRTEV